MIQGANTGSECCNYSVTEKAWQIPWRSAENVDSFLCEKVGEIIALFKTRILGSYAPLILVARHNFMEELVKGGIISCTRKSWTILVQIFYFLKTVTWLQYQENGVFVVVTAQPQP